MERPAPDGYRIIPYSYDDGEGVVDDECVYYVNGEYEGRLDVLVPAQQGEEEDEDKEEDVGSDCESLDSGLDEEEDEEEEEEKEEEEEEEEDEDDPLTQRLPPRSFWEGYYRVPMPTPSPFPAGHPLSLPFGVERPEEAPPLVPQRSEESTKRSREGDRTEQVSVKRQRTGDHEDAAPSTSGLGPLSLPFGVERPEEDEEGVGPVWDSWYDSVFKDAEDEEEEEEEEGEGFHRVLTPSPAGHPLSLPFGVEHPEEAPPLVPQRSEESTKRSREGDRTEQVSVKRQRTGDHEDAAPSTSGLGPLSLPFGVERPEEDEEEDVGPDWNAWYSWYDSMFKDAEDEEEEEEEEGEGFHQVLTPSPAGHPLSLPFGVERPEEASPLVPQRSEESTKRSREQVSVKRQRTGDHEDAAPSTSGLGSSKKRTREEDYRWSLPSTSGLGSSKKRTREEDYRWSLPSTSGLGSSKKRPREEDYRWSLPSTSGLSFLTHRRFWQSAEDSDSD